MQKTFKALLDAAPVLFCLWMLLSTGMGCPVDNDDASPDVGQNDVVDDTGRPSDTADDGAVDTGGGPDTIDDATIADSGPDLADTVSDPPPGDRPCTLDGDECEANERCVPFGSNESLVCRPAGTLPVGSPCVLGAGDECVAGAVCVAYDEETSFCAELCDPNDDGEPCLEGVQICLPWFGPSSMTAGICIGDDCSPPAVGCDDGERCTVLVEQVLACVPEGSVSVGGDCSEANCVAGAICRSVDFQATCLAFCHNASDCPGTDDHCVWPWSELTEWGYCRPGCDPVTQTDCEDDEGCYFMDPEIGSTDCWMEGDLVEGADCSSFTELCEPGLDCVLEPGSDPFEYYCRAYCDAEVGCPAGRSCQLTEAMGALKVCMPDS